MGRKRRETEADVEKKKQFLEKVGNYLAEYQRNNGCSQAFVAQKLRYRADTFWRWVNGDNSMPLTAIQAFCRLLGLDDKQTLELLYLAGYVIAPTLFSGSPHPSLMSENLPDNIVPDPEMMAARTKYLEIMCRRYGSVTLPLGPPQGFSLQAVFQPLKLRRDPLAAEDLAREGRRALLGESRTSETDPGRVFSSSHDRQFRDQVDRVLPVVIAENGDDALRKSSQRSLVVLGGPGTGKTTLLKHLVGDRAREALTDPMAPLPILISLPPLARSGKTLKEYLTSTVQDMMVYERFAQVLWDAFQQVKAFVCLDSLDEVAPRERPEQIRLINEWASTTTSISVVGSRFTDYKGGQLRSELFAEWELLPMNPPLRRELAKRLLPELCRLMRPEEVWIKEKGPIFVDLLEQHEQIAAWSENPLLFSLAAVAFVSTGTLPSSRTLLYQEVIDAILILREPDRTWQEMLHSALAFLALELYQEKGRTFTRNDLLRLLRLLRKRQDEHWNTEEIVYRVLDSGIVDVVARDTYGFRHQTYQEYFAAIELAQRLTSPIQMEQEAGWNLAWSKRTYSRWIEVLRLMVGVLVQEYRQEGLSKALQWLRELVGQRMKPEGDPGELGLTLAVRSLGEVTHMAAWESAAALDVERKVISTWIEELLESASHVRYAKSWRHASLAHEVGRLHSRPLEVAVNQLTAAFTDRDKNVREAAVKAAGELGKHIPIELILALLQDREEDVRRAAVEALGRRGEQIPFDRLLAMLWDERIWHNEPWYESWFSKLVLPPALREQGKWVSQEQLHALLQDKRWDIRWLAVKMLGQQDERISVDLLIAMLHDESWNVRQAVVEALSEYGEQVPVEPLLSMLQDESWTVCRAAVETLGKLGERAPIQPLLAMLPDAYWQLKPAVVRALGGLGERAPIQLLLAMLQDQDQWVRRAAVEALGKIGERAPLEPLLAMLHDRDNDVREATVEALGKLGGRVPIEPLLAMLQDWGDFEMARLAAINVLGKYGGRFSSLELITNISYQDWRMRVAAVQVLHKRGEQIPVESLLTMLKKESWFVRSTVAEALGWYTEQAPVKLLLAMLQDEDEYVRWAVVRALGRQKASVPGKPLMSMLQDESRLVRREVLHTLGERGEGVPVGWLLLMLQDRDMDVRMAAVKMLGKHEEQIPLEPLLAMLQDENEYVRRAAVEALGRQGKRVPLELLTATLNDKASHVRHAAVRVLDMRGEKVSVELLLLMLREGFPGAPRGVVEALEKQKKQVPIESLLEILQDRGVNPNVWGDLARLLCRLGERVPAEPLVSLLQDNDGWRRYVAMEALGERIPLETLLVVLQDKEPIVRSTAIKMLGRLREQILIEPLVAALEDEDGSVRAAAVRALGNLGEQVSLEPLLTMLQDRDKYVRSAVIETLGKLGERMPQDLLTAAVGDEYEDVRRTAINVLNEVAPEALATVVNEAKAVLQGQPPGMILGSLAQGGIADLIGGMKNASPELLDMLTELLDWHYWQVRVKAAQALGQIHRSIPNAAIQRLLELQRDPDPKMHAVREATNDALAEILSLETGIEDDQT